MLSTNPVLLAFLCFAAGIVLSRLADFSFAEISFALAAYLLLASLSQRRSLRRLTLLNVLAAVFCCGILTDIWRHPGPAPEIEFEPGETMLLAGCVVEPPALFPGREVFVLELDRDARVRVQFYLKDGEDPPRLRYGQEVELPARLRQPRNYGNPGAFDYEGYLARRQIYWTASARDPGSVRVTGNNCGTPWRAAIFSLRQAVLDRLDRVYSSDAHALGLSRAVLAGDASRLEKVWIENYRRTGTYHALVISGLHITVFAACFLFLFRVVGVPQTLALILTTAVGWIYAFMTGAGTPVLRAAAGLMLYTLARFFFRTPRILNIVSAIGLIFLAADPEQLFDPSFQLSFLAVALIGGVAVPLLESTTLPYSRALGSLDNQAWDLHLPPRVASFRLEIRLLAETMNLLTRLPYRAVLWLCAGAGRVVSFCWELMVVSAVVQAGLTLPMIAYFHRVSLSGLSANLFIVPLTNLLVPAGFLALLTGWSPLVWITTTIVNWSGRIAQYHAGFDPSWRVPDPPAWLAAALLIALALVAASFHGRRRWQLAAAGMCGLLMWALISHPFRPHYEPGMLELTAMDVGQGDSLLVTSPEGKMMLVDTGGSLAFGRATASTFNMGEDVVSTYLWSRSIQTLDVLALTHAHEDHIGGAIAILENFRPRQLWMGAFPETGNWRAIRECAKRMGAEIVQPTTGWRRPWGGAGVEVLSPAEDYVPKARAHNNESLVMRLTYGSTSFLLTGDMERQIEARLVSEGLVGRTDVLKVAHHGSKSSSTAPFLEAARPAFALISDGAGNLFRHPHPEVLERFGGHNSSVWRTDLHGMITVVSDGRRVRLQARNWPLRTQTRFQRSSAGFPLPAPAPQ